MISIKPHYFLAITLYCIGIFWLSHQSNPPVPENQIFLFPGADKVAHCLLYAGLGALVSIAIRRSNSTVKAWIQWFVPIAFAILYGLSDEVHQLYVPERSFELLDLLSDGVGATIAQVGLYIIWRKQEPNSE
jgi:VanZ family protein